MIRWLDTESDRLFKAFQDTSAECRKKGGKIMTFAPGVKPSKTRS